jgi:hypothetical protein
MTLVAIVTSTGKAATTAAGALSRANEEHQGALGSQPLFIRAWRVQPAVVGAGAGRATGRLLEFVRLTGGFCAMFRGT